VIQLWQQIPSLYVSGISFTDSDAGLKYDASCSFIMSKDIPVIEIERILHRKELSIYAGFPVELRKTSFLAGRFAAKTAYAQLSGNCDLSDLLIENAFSGEPILRSPFRHDLSVSISHTDNCAFAVVFPDMIQAAVDVEEIIDEHGVDLISVLSAREISGKPEDIDFSTYAIMLWSGKEALVKALRIGFKTNFKNLEISDFRMIRPGVFTGDSISFSGFRIDIYVLHEMKKVISVAYPKKLNLVSDINFVTDNFFNHTELNYVFRSN
jgi:phosphopantetheinyl transferase (holo-ACP synthase)